MSEKHIVTQQTNDAQNRIVCDTILTSLPDWFGSREANDEYIDDLKTRPVFGVDIGGQTAGIMALTRTSPATFDIHLMAVAPDQHGNGIGTALVRHAIDFARTNGAKFLTVKTLGPSRDNAAYARTRHFYDTQGFAALEEFIDFWGDGYPMLLLCQNINPSRT